MDYALEYNLFGERLLGDFIEEKAKGQFNEALLKVWKSDQVGEIVTAYGTVAFETGFALGQLFDLEDPEAKAYVDALIQEMRGKQAIPLFPKQKK